MKNAVFWDVTPCGPCKKDVSEVRINSIIKVIRLGELGTTLAFSYVSISSRLVWLRIGTGGELL
jgi:hypothetical protein